jgi:hypothetical protein
VRNTDLLVGFACTLDMAAHDASQGIGCGSSGGIVNSTEIFTKLFRCRRDYQESSLNSVDIASSSSSIDILTQSSCL